MSRKRKDGTNSNSRSLEAKIRRGKKRHCRRREIFQTLQEAAIRAAYLYINNGYYNSSHECPDCGKWHNRQEHQITPQELFQLNQFVSELRFTRNDRLVHI